MTLCWHPVIEMSKVLGFGLHPDEGRLGGKVFQAFGRGVLVLSVISAYLVSFKKSGGAWNAGVCAHLRPM